MIYTKSIPTPANTPASDPEHAVVDVTKGLVYRIEVQFPPGPADLCHVVVCDGLYQVWPSNPEETFHTDGTTIAFEDTYLKLIQPYQFDIYTFNLDDTYSHTPLVRIGLVSQEIFMARFLPSYSWEYFKKMLEELQEEQEERYAEVIATPFSWIGKESNGQGTS